MDVLWDDKSFKSSNHYRYLYRILLSVIDGVIADKTYNGKQVDFQLIEERLLKFKSVLVSGISSSVQFVEALNSALNSKRSPKFPFATVCQLMHALCEAHYADQGQFLYFDISSESGHNNVQKVSKALAKLRSSIISFSFLKEIDSLSSHSLSSGELSMLCLFSRIAQHNKKNFPHGYDFILLDEAETSFHPEWQRSYIKILTNTINSISKSWGSKPQIIITSHSPILLSDIPRCCSNYIKSENGITSNAKEEIGETFAANVFDLYRYSFFLNNGLIGAFAEEKIKECSKKIDSRKFEDSDLQIIDLIGDEIVKRYLLQTIKDLYGTEDKSFYKQMAEYYSLKAKELSHK